MQKIKIKNQKKLCLRYFQLYIIDIFKNKSFNEELLDLQIKDDLYLLDIIPSKEEKILDMLIKKEAKEELEDSLNNLSNDDNFIIFIWY